MRIAIVNDTLMSLECLKIFINTSTDHEVAWSAENGKIAAEMCMNDTPDLILMDLIMPVMDGVESCKQIMKNSPCAILIVTSSITNNSSMVFNAMGEGALDAVNTPVLNPNHPDYNVDDLLFKINTIETLISYKKPKSLIKQASIKKNESNKSAYPLLVIGASTGGPAALVSVLKDIPSSFSAAIIVIQHIDQQFCPGFAIWLDEQIALPARLAKEGEKPISGQILISVGNKHLNLNSNQYLTYTEEPVDYPYKPSINVFFNSVATNWQGDAYGVLLTGMGKDGAEGLLALKQQGYPTIAQDEKSSAVYGMPKEAYKLNAAKYILPLVEINSQLVNDLT